MTDEQWAENLSSEFKLAFRLIFETHTQVMLKSLVLTVRREALKEAAAYAKVWWIQHYDHEDAMHVVGACEGIARELEELAGEGTKQ